MKKVQFILLLVVINLIFAQANVSVYEPTMSVDGFEIVDCGLMWTTTLTNDDTELISHRIYFESSPSGNDHYIEIEGLSAGTHQFSFEELFSDNLLPDTDYLFGVTAVCKVIVLSNGLPYEEIKYYPADPVYFHTPQDLPQSISPSNITHSSFTANWNEFNGATGYRIDVDDDDDFSSPLEEYNDLEGV